MNKFLESKPCLFCTLRADRIVNENSPSLAVVIRDGYPVSPGHTLVLPKRHVGSFFHLSAAERVAVMGLLDVTKDLLDKEFAPDAYNVGFNDGPCAGQTVPHVHVHLIPGMLATPAMRAAACVGFCPRKRTTGHDKRRDHHCVRFAAGLAAWRQACSAQTLAGTFCTGTGRQRGGQGY